MRPHTQRLFNDYLPGRRSHLSSTTPNSSGLAIPPAQSLAPQVSFDTLDYRPASGNQEEEYFTISNDSAEALDLSGWTVSGGIEMTFAAGTVIPAGNGLPRSNYRGLLHIAKSSQAFRSRSQGPTGGEYRLIQQGYTGQLSARGESLELRNREGQLVAQTSYPATPSLAQQWLRVSELNYHPAEPTSAELAQDATLQDNDFEFIELIKTGQTSLSLDGLSLVEGVTFDFPAGEDLASDERILLVANPAAFAIRYDNSHRVLGPYLGSLDNGGETLRIHDQFDENVLVFDWSDDWFPPTDGDGHTLVLRDLTTPYKDFDQPERWAISENINGSPSTNDDSYQLHFEAWRFAKFDKVERADPLLGQKDSDPDQDRRSNWEEYVFATDPWNPDRPSLEIIFVEENSEFFPALQIERRRNAYDIAWELQRGTNLENWSPDLFEVAGTPTSPNGETEQTTLKSLAPRGSLERKVFLRLKATQDIPEG